MGLVFGSQLHIEIDARVKNLFFTMFLFALGYRVGPQFFRGLKKDGLPQVLDAIIVCVTGLLVCWAFASLLGYGPGLSPDQAREQSNLVAVTYPLGTILAAILLATVLPRLYKKDLAAECAALATPRPRTAPDH